MIVAVPAFGTMISPRFDCAPRVLIFDCANPGSIGRIEHVCESDNADRRIRFLIDQRIEVILCGGIRRCDYFSLIDRDIQVFAGLVGEVDRCLKDYLSGRLSVHPPWESCRRRGGPFSGKGRGGGGAPPSPP